MPEHSCGGPGSVVLPQGEVCDGELFPRETLVGFSGALTQEAGGAKMTLAAKEGELRARVQAQKPAGWVACVSTSSISASSGSSGGAVGGAWPPRHPAWLTSPWRANGARWGQETPVLRNFWSG